MNPRSRRRRGRPLAVAGPTEGLGAEAALPGAAGNDVQEGVRRALPSADLIGVAGRDDGTQPLAAHLATECDVFGRPSTTTARTCPASSAACANSLRPRAAPSDRGDPPGDTEIGRAHV